MTDRLRLSENAFTPLPPLSDRVSRVGVGTSQLDDRIAAHREALRAALEAGLNLIDTAATYGGGRAETLVGEVLAETGARDVVLVTKAGYVKSREPAGARWAGDVHEGRGGLRYCVAPGFLGDRLSSSLSRLRKERVDLYLLHNPEGLLEGIPSHGADAALDAFYARLGLAFEHLEHEADAGRITAYGISSNGLVLARGEARAVDLARVLSVAGPRFRAIQLPMNPAELGARDSIHTRDGRSVLDVARAAGLHVLVNRPLQSGAGRFVDARPPFVPVHPVPEDGWERLESAETEFARVWAPLLRLGASTDDLLASRAVLRGIERDARDLIHVGRVFAREIAPRLEETLPQLAEAFAGDEAFHEFAERYTAAVHAAATQAIVPALAGEGLRRAALDRLVADAFGPVPGRTLSQRVLRGLAGTDGVAVVLLGMRSLGHVEDAVGAWGEAETR